MPEQDGPSRSDAPSQPAPKRILIIRPTALGDVARTVPVLATLRVAYPDAHIDWLVAKAFAPAIRHHPMLDGVVEFDRKALSRFGRSFKATGEGRRFARMLREKNYDAVYDLQGLLRSGLFTRLTRAQHRVGFANAREFGWLGYNVSHHVDTDLHTVDRMLGLLKADGLEPIHDMRLYLSDEDKAWLENFKHEHAIADGGYACLAPTARWGCKCWPLERYGEIARRMIEQGLSGDKLVLIASPDEREQVLPIFEVLMGDGPSASKPDLRENVVFPDTNVGQMMALLSEARVLVCNDSAPLHIAVGFDRPVVTLFGPTDPALVGPYRYESSVLRPADADQYQASYRKLNDDPSLIGKITVEEVWGKVNRLLSNEHLAPDRSVTQYEMKALQELRDDLHRSQSDASRAIAFYHLCNHPDITWNDLIGCLQYPVLIREQATLLLYKHIGLSPSTDSFITDPDYWLQFLDERSINPNSVIGGE